MKIFLTLLIAFLGSLSAVINNGKNAFDFRRVWYKSLTPAGWKVLTIIMLILVCMYYQLVLDSNETSQKDIQYKKEKKSDSLMLVAINERQKIHFDTTIKGLGRSFGEAIGKYGLRFDSTDKYLKKIDEKKDNKIDPVLRLCSDNHISLADIKDGFKYYSINFCCEEAGVRDINIKISVAFGDSVDTVPLQENLTMTFFSSGPESPKHYLGPKMGIDHNDRYDIIIVWVRGSYKNMDRSQDYPVDDYAVYYLKHKKSVRLNSRLFPRLKKYFEGIPEKLIGKN